MSDLVKTKDGYKKENVHIAFAIMMCFMLLFGVSIGYMICDLHPKPYDKIYGIDNDTLHVYSIGYFHNSLGHSFPFIVKNMTSYNNALQEACDDLRMNAKGGSIWED